MGLHQFLKDNPNHKQLSVLELGFGTGLNAMLTAIDEMTQHTLISYHGIEAYPISLKELEALDYNALFDSTITFNQLHEIPWNQIHKISSNFQLNKRKEFFSELSESKLFDVVYFDAFGPRVQPDLWTTDMFERVYKAMRPNGILVTYSAKGSVRRSMQEVGFVVERLPGPPGKREMLRASRPA
jgi:tRNA U34 5-methylaminomethyl-2-thiouridine-forming methyltransferase MnmC